MTGQFSRWVPYLPWLVGSLFVLWAAWIGLKSESRRYFRDKDVLKIISELTETWRAKSRGHARAFAITGICLFAVLMFAAVPLRHVLLPAPEMVAHWWYFPHIPEVMPSNVYVVLHMAKDDPLYGTRSRYTFCAKGHDIDIDEGEMVKDVVFRDHGECIELVHYNYEREDYYPFPVKHYPEEAQDDGR